MSKPARIALVLAGAGIALFLLTRPGDGPPSTQGTTTPPINIDPADLTPPKPPVIEVPATGQPTGPTFESVLAKLPKEPYPAPLHRRNERAEIQAAEPLFRQLGTLGGARALDAIASRYDDGAFVLHAFGLALEGWATVDPEAAADALAAVIGQVEEQMHESRTEIRFWDGDPLHIEGDFGFIHLGSAANGALAAITRASPEAGLAFLHDDDVEDYTNFMNAFTTNLPPDTSWAETEAKLYNILERRGFPDHGDPVREAVARGWVRQDIDAAVAYYIDGLPEDGLSRQFGPSTLLHSMGDHDRALTWLETAAAAGTVTDETLRHFAAPLWRDESGDHLRRIVALPSDPVLREQIVAPYLKPITDRDSPQLWFPPETLHALIDAARLPADSATHWRTEVDNNRDLPVYDRDQDTR